MWATEERLIVAWNQLDTNRDGRVGLAELSQALGGGAWETADVLAAEVMQVYDADNDGFISFDEFKSLMLDNMNNH